MHYDPLPVPPYHLLGFREGQALIDVVVVELLKGDVDLSDDQILIVSAFNQNGHTGCIALEIIKAIRSREHKTALDVIQLRIPDRPRAIHRVKIETRRTIIDQSGKVAIRIAQELDHQGDIVVEKLAKIGKATRHAERIVVYSRVGVLHRQGK